MTHLFEHLSGGEVPPKVQLAQARHAHDVEDVTALRVRTTKCAAYLPGARLLSGQALGRQASEAKQLTRNCENPQDAVEGCFSEDVVQRRTVGIGPDG